MSKEASQLEVNPAQKTMETNRCFRPRGSDTKTIQNPPALPSAVGSKPVDDTHLELEKQHEGPNKGKTAPYCSLLRGVLT